MMKARSFFQMFLGSLLGVLGFSACSHEMEYGCKFAEYIVQGRVLNENGGSLEHACVQNVYLRESTEGDTVLLKEMINNRNSDYTDSHGSYQIRSVKYYDGDLPAFPYYDSDTKSFLFRYSMGENYEIFDTIIPEKSIIRKKREGSDNEEAIIEIDAVLKRKKK